MLEDIVLVRRVGGGIVICHAIVAAREELLIHDLIAHQPPLTQVLSLPRARVARAGLHGLGELFRTLKDMERDSRP